jgi:hypothetical protein
MRSAMVLVGAWAYAFLLGFLAQTVEGAADRALIGLALLVAPMLVLAARLSRRDLAALVGGALLFGAAVAAAVGAYSSEVVGAAQFGSDDTPGWVFLVFYLLMVCPWAFVAGTLIGWLAGNFRRGAAADTLSGDG